MQITRAQLKQLIAEAIEKALYESDNDNLGQIVSDLIFAREDHILGSKRLRASAKGNSAFSNKLNQLSDKALKNKLIKLGFNVTDCIDNPEGSFIVTLGDYVIKDKKSKKKNPQ